MNKKDKEFCVEFLEGIGMFCITMSALFAVSVFSILLGLIVYIILTSLISIV